MTMDENIIFGINPVLALLADPDRSVDSLTVLKGGHGKRLQEAVDLARQRGIRPRFVDRQSLDRLTGGLSHQGLSARAAIRRQPSFKQILPKFLAGKNSLLLLLDSVEDPRNLGAIIRSAEAFGVTAVIVPKDRSAALSASAAKTSAGAAERMDVVRITNLAHTITELKEADVRVVGLVGEEKRSIHEESFSGPTALVLGGEGKGLRHLTRERCDTLVSIPIIGGVGSLNVAVAGGIACYEVRRKQRENHV